jgi:hypothetical protein
MRQQVEQVIKSAHLEPSASHTRNPIPFMPETTLWPPVDGYMVTRARDSATLFLQSDAGHPLFAAHHVGAARVAVLSAGFQQWSDAWLRWPLWGRFAGGLLQWLSINYNAPELYADIIEHSDRLELQLDALDKKGGWNDNANTTVQLTDPDHNISSHRLAAVAPGRYSAVIPTAKVGHYHMSIEHGGNVIQRDYMRNSNREFSAASKGRERFNQWHQQGLITSWTSLPNAIKLAATIREIDSRPYLLVAAVLAYFAFMFFEYRGRYNLPFCHSIQTESKLSQTER